MNDKEINRNVEKLKELQSYGEKTGLKILEKKFCVWNDETTFCLHY
jgi:hypothetical protein